MNTEAREQLLISRIIDGDASVQEWQDFEVLAVRSPHIWRELAEAQRDHAALMRGVAATIALADDLPLPSRRDAFAEGDSSYRFQQQLHRLSAWAGWAVAAVLVLALTPWGRQFSGAGGAPQQTSLGPAIATADDALKSYYNLGQKDGRVLGEVPARVMVQSNPAPSGQGFEVIYLRQIIEKTTVPDLYQFAGHDERGEPTLKRMRVQMRGSM